MNQQLTCVNLSDDEGNPTGGHANGVGINISWQDGPLGRGDDRMPPNGAFVEGVIEAALQRLQYYQSASLGRFACKENELAILELQGALFQLDRRTQRREAEGVEGTHEGS